MANQPRAIGLDFGTTNSAIAAVGTDGTPRLARFPTVDGPSAAFRSLLYFERDEPEDGGRLHSFAGPDAIARYLQAEEPGRLMQSLKSFLASRHFSSTDVFGSTYRLEALIDLILRRLRDSAERQLGDLGERLVVGRPVRFATAAGPDDEALALARLRAAFHNAGFPEVEFEHEPIAAAYEYRRCLEGEDLILIGDFGGGTSDFCLLRVGPLGGAAYRSMFDRVLRVPLWIYSHLERWHHLSFLKSRRTMQLLLDLRREALEPERFEALIHIVNHDLGFHLYRSVERTKMELSSKPRSRFRFRHPPVEIDVEVQRSDFEEWIGEEIDAIASCVDGLLSGASVSRSEVDRVFLTGGSSFVPAVRELFASRFGAGRVRTGGELTSVASGLALCARERSG
jgi:hypothetical chaperone protein